MDNSKSQEKLVVSSGSVLCVDQFMLANQQCLAACASGEDPKEVVRRYGGAIFDFPNGEYRVFRDAKLQIVAIAESDAALCHDDEDGLGAVIESFGPSAVSDAKVMIDTRCIVLIDSSIFSNAELLEKFAQARKEDKEKEARDLLREQGAAVRYGFNKWGDELTLFYRTSPDVLAALWPE